MLRPPDGNRCTGEQERQLAKIAFPTMGPPFPCETQQDFDDITEADIGTGRDLLVYGIRKRNVAQDGERHGNNCGIRFVNRAVPTTCGKLSVALVDSGHDREKMNCGTLLAAL